MFRVPARSLRLLRGMCSKSHGTNFFNVLGVGQRFDLDSTDLSARFKALQREWHPDKHAGGGSGSAPEKAADMSALLNQAYGTLKAPHSRASHLLQVLGVDTDNTELDPEFLVWVVECRERIADAELDSPETEALGKEVEAELEQCLGQLNTAFEESDLTEAAILTSKFRYLDRMRVAIEELS